MTNPNPNRNPSRRGPLKHPIGSGVLTIALWLAAIALGATPIPAAVGAILVAGKVLM